MTPAVFYRPATLALAAVAAAALGAIAACNRSPADSHRSIAFTLPQPSPLSPPVPPRPLPGKLPSLSPDIPFDVACAAKQADAESLRREFDAFSWRTFIALSWPALPDGEPDRSQTIGQQGDHATVWENWMPAAQIFLPEARPPAPWGAPPPVDSLPSLLRDLPPGTRVLTQFAKTHGPRVEVAQSFDPAPLIDQNGRYVRVESLVNRPMFDTIIAQRLYDRQAQAAVQKIAFPHGANKGPDAGVGSIMIKAAWKILSPAEASAGRFHAVQAALYTPASASPSRPELVEHVTVGLVGLHIAHKTASAPQWTWATFEHVDNSPTLGEAPYRAAYNFYNKNTPAAPANVPPEPPWDPTVTEPPHRRSQIVRLIPIEPHTRALNASYQAALRAINPASVWQYYELVGTQSSSAPAAGHEVAASIPGSAGATPTAAFLSAATLDTYARVPSLGAGPNCIDCHRNATTATGAFSDFTHLLRRAH